MKKIVIVDGQGGRLGAMLVEAIKRDAPDSYVLAIGTNSAASAAMRKAGADAAATGENPVMVACRDADVIAGPIGIVCTDALLGEITPKMAAAIGAARAEKLLIPVNRCGIQVVGVRAQSMADAVAEAAARIRTDIIGG